MSNYIYTADGLVNADELAHYGVPGMRWGHRKAGFVSTIKYRPKGPNSGGLYNKHKLKGPNSGGLYDKHEAPKNAKYVTGYQAKKKATLAANEARKKSIAESRASGDKGVGSFQRANRKALNAKRKAYGESMKADMDYNKQLKAEKKAAKNEFRKSRSDVSKSRSTGAKLATNLLAGPFANRTYNSVIASGGSKTSARAMTAVAAIMGGPIGHMAVSALYTHDAAKK